MHTYALSRPWNARISDQASRRTIDEWEKGFKPEVEDEGTVVQQQMILTLPRRCYDVWAARAPSLPY
jgi:hypothetical protein